MKKPIKIFSERIQINEEKLKLENRLQGYKNDLIKLQDECTHELVLTFDKHMPRRVGKIIMCYCPACGKIEKVIARYYDVNRIFENSKIVDLTEVPIGYFNGAFPVILEYIFTNYDFCYSDEVSGKQIADAIISIINEDKKDNYKAKIKTPNSSNKKDD